MGDGVGDADGDGVAVGDGVAEGVGEGVAEGVGVNVGTLDALVVEPTSSLAFTSAIAAPAVRPADTTSATPTRTRDRVRAIAD